jgi:hypothetical protein
LTLCNLGLDRPTLSMILLGLDPQERGDSTRR